MEGEYDTICIDCNPSFSIYPQIALSAVDRLVLPVMAEDSSRRAIQNAFSLVYGLRRPSDIYLTYAFATPTARRLTHPAEGAPDREEPHHAVRGLRLGLRRRVSLHR